MSTVALAQRLVPEFAPLSAADVGDWLGDATIAINAAAFGTLAGHAIANLAGHLYVQAQRGAAGGLGSAGGPVTAKGARSWSVAFGATSTSTSSGDQELAETVYGRRYLELRKRAGLGSARVL